MKKLVLFTVLFLFTFQSFSKSDDISNFELLNMSVGDRAIDHFTQNEINQFQYGFESKLFAYVNLKESKLEKFNDGFVIIKPEDKNFLIHSIVVRKFFNNDINECFKEQDKTINELSNIFESVEATDKDTYEYSADTSGKSKVTTVNLILDDGSSGHIGCYNMSKDFLLLNNYNPETAVLSISLNSKEYSYWQMNR